MVALFTYFVKITGWIAQKIVFRPKYYYEDKALQSRKIKGRAIIASNHTSVYDYAVMLFAFPLRTLRYQMAEVLFKKKLLGLFLKMTGGIKVDRYANDGACIEKSLKVLKKGGVVGVFPESRLPKKDENGLLEFKNGAAYLAFSADVPVIPVYLSGGYFTKKRAKVVIGKPLNLWETYDENKSEKENIEVATKRLKDKIIDLGKLLDEK